MVPVVQDSRVVVPMRGPHEVPYEEKVPALPQLGVQGNGMRLVPDGRLVLRARLVVVLGVTLGQVAP
jgi:hypothetical protein